MKIKPQSVVVLNGNSPYIVVDILKIENEEYALLLGAKEKDKPFTIICTEVLEGDKCFLKAVENEYLATKVHGEFKKRLQKVVDESKKKNDK